MRSDTKQLYQFMTSCGGNWRNTLYVYGLRRSGEGILVTFDRDAKPTAVRVERLCELSGESIDVKECRAMLSIEEFRDIYKRYLLWHTSSDDDVFAILCGDKGGTP